MRTANGEEQESEVYLIKLELLNPKTGEKRSCEVEAVVLGGRDYPLLGISAMEMLRITPDVPRREVIFE